MQLTLTNSISAATVFVQGLLSFFSPCVLPLLPVYIGYLSGGTAVMQEDGSMTYDRKKVLVNTVFFVLGISFAFFLLGLCMSLIGVFLRQHQALFAAIGIICSLVNTLAFYVDSKMLHYYTFELIVVDGDWRLLKDAVVTPVLGFVALLLAERLRKAGLVKGDSQ